jgi:chloramphenicol-sensitive protein RarD
LIDQTQIEQRRGLLFAFGAFLSWGLAPIYWKALGAVPPLQLLSHRTFWCALMMVWVIARRHDFGTILALRHEPRKVLLLALTTALIGFNWYLYIWAVVNGQIIAASFGYFFTPLVNVALGMVFLGERLRPWQALAVALAAVGVGIKAWDLGHLPWISLALSLSFAFYGLLRKVLKVSPENGLALETWLLAPLVLGQLIHAESQGVGAFLQSGPWTDVLLIGSGIITGVPLLWFTHGARLLPLKTLGLMQYISPTCQFLLAVFVYGEPFGTAQAGAFVFIWVALIVFTADARRRGL